MFEPLPRLFLGLFTGFLFGVLLQKGRVAKYRVIVGQFLLRDWTVVKVMGTAVVVGAIGVYALRQMGIVSLHIKPTLLGGVIAGGALFGIGMGLLGYCPGTSVAACGEGRKDAIAGVFGQLLGAGLFVAAYRWLDPVINWAISGRSRSQEPPIRLLGCGSQPWQSPGCWRGTGVDVLDRPHSPRGALRQKLP